MALHVQSEPDLASEFVLNVVDLNALWSQFKMDNDSVLDLLSVNITQRLIPTGADAVDLSYLRDVPSSVQKPREDLVQSLSRLPDIPLPTFEGDYRSWPNFRDRFSTLVDTRSNLSNIDKMYYLVGCLKGAAADAVDRFNRPRLVVTSFVDKLLRSSAMTQKSLNDLNTFVGMFSESNIHLII